MTNLTITDYCIIVITITLFLKALPYSVTRFFSWNRLRERRSEIKTCFELIEQLQCRIYEIENKKRATKKRKR